MRPLNTFEDMPPEPNKTPPFLFYFLLRPPIMAAGCGPPQLSADRSADALRSSPWTLLWRQELQPWSKSNCPPCWFHPETVLEPTPSNYSSWARRWHSPPRCRCQTERWQCRDIIILSSSIQSASAHGPPTSPPHQPLLLLGKQCQTNTYWE